MIKEIKTTYKCDFCKKHMFRSDAMLRHESICPKNPENFVMCNGCNHLEEYEKDYQCAHGEYSYGRHSKSFYCKKYEKGLYPPKAKHLVEQYPDTFEDEEQMPKECEHYNSDLPF